MAAEVTIAVALALSLFSGCAELNRTVYSRAREVETQAFPGILSFAQPVVEVSVPLNEVDLKITPHNSRTSISFLFVGFLVPIPLPGENCHTTSFHVCLYARPKGSRVLIDPFQVVLRTKDGDFTPSSVDLAKYGCCTCPPHPEASPVKEVPLRIDRQVHVDLCFPVHQLSPDVPFTLIVNGLANLDQPIMVESLNFEKATMWNYHVQPIFR